MKSLSQADCDRMRRLCAVHTLEVVAELMHIHKDTVWRIRKRGFVATTGGPARRPMPYDFRIQMDLMGIHELARHYQTGQGCVRRWIAEAGRRDFTPRSSARVHVQQARPARDIVETAVARHGATRAAAELGVTPSTLQKWREFYGLPIQHKRVVQLRKRPTQRGWVDRYRDQRAA